MGAGQNVLVIAEHFNGKIQEGTLSAVSFARKLLYHTGGELFVLVGGYKIAGIARELSFYEAGEILVADNEQLFYLTPDGPFKDLVVKMVNELGCGFVVAASSSFSKDFMPRVAARLKVGMVSDVSGLSFGDNELLFERMIYAGNIRSAVALKSGGGVITIRQSAFEKAQKQGKNVKIKKLDFSEVLESRTKFVELIKSKSARPDLQTATVVVSAGRGIKDKEGLKLVEELADLLGAAVGASRAVVDAELMPNDLQVGQTGKIVAPDVYIAIGISGAIQHLAGIKDSKTIIAINKDVEAPIFQSCDLGIVGDFRQVVPELIEAIKTKKA